MIRTRKMVPMITQMNLRITGLSLALGLTLATLLLPAELFALQDPFGGTEATEPQEEPEGDALGRDTPRGAVVGFVTATEAFDFERAALYLDLRNLPGDVREIPGPELARQLDFVFKRGGVSFDELLFSRRPEGQTADDLPDYRDELARLKSPDEEFLLLLQRVPGPDDDFIWKVSNLTVGKIPELYDVFSYPDWLENLSSRLPQGRSYFGIELFKWIIVLSLGFVVGPILWLTFHGLVRLFCKRSNPLYKEIHRLFTGPLVILILLNYLSWLFKELGLGATGQAWFRAGTLVTVGWVWFTFAIVDLIRGMRREKYLAQGRSDAAVLGRPLANALKLFVLLFASIVWLHNAGINITTLMAGLGIGGVAVALALQKPIEDLLGALSIYSQQPVVTGDLCKYKTHFGRIEEIGLRTTRIRTLANTMVSIPNSQMAYGEIENYAVRETMLHHPFILLRYDSTPEQVKTLMKNLSDFLYEDEGVVSDKVRVRFTDYQEHGILIRPRIYVDTDDFDVYLKVVSRINLAILDIVAEAGAQFAQGARTVFLENQEPR
jgi:MscS family membrane protein